MKPKFKVLFFATPYEFSSKQDLGIYPLGISYLGAVLERKGYRTNAFTFLFDDWEKAKPNMIEIIKSENPDVIGISSMTTNRTSSFELAKIIKSINPEIKVILGGVHPTIMYEQILENLPVDFIVLGEGEETMAELIKALENKSPLKELRKIKGIAFKNDGEIVKTETRQFIQNLDTLPFPKHEYFEDKIRKFGIVYITTSRGCPIGCTFCSTTKHWGKLRRRRSVENVIKELKMIKQKFPYAKEIQFQDDEFVMDNDWVEDFCNKFIKEKINLKFRCVGRVTSINDRVVSKLVKAGCLSINLGVESGSPKIINFIEKKITNEQAINAFKVCARHNLKAGLFLIVGLPGEDSKTINETISLLKNIPTAQLEFPALFLIFPGTQTYGLAKEQGFITDDYWLTDKPVPYYTYEHSKKQLLLWSVKIALYHKYYQGKLFSFLLSKLKDNLKPKRFLTQIKKYAK
jgi:radical SAM superfamily enzyme YgiQ (UPF0313 family)